MSRLLPARFNKYLILVLSLFLIILAVFIYANVFRGTTMGPNTLYIKHSFLSDGSLLLDGSTSSSANAFKDYSYRIEADKLLLKIRYVPLVSRWYPTGSFQILLSKQDLEGIREVYLYQNNNNNKRLLWSEA